MYTVDSYLYDDVTEDAEGNATLPSRPLHHLDTDYYITDATLEMKMNKAGTFTFTIPFGSKSVENIEVMRSFLTVYTDKPEPTFLWAGRPISVETDLYGNRTYTAEGLLSILNDVYVERRNVSSFPLLYFMNNIIIVYLQWCKGASFYVTDKTGLPQDEPGKTFLFPDYVPPACTKMAVFSKMTADDISDSLLYVDQYVGNGENGTQRVERTLKRWWSKFETAMEIMQTRVIDYFGGFLEIDAKNGALGNGFFRLRYLDPTTLRLNQIVEIGKNVLEISASYAAEDFYTAVIPVEIGEDGEEKPIYNTDDDGTAATNCFWTYYGGADGILVPGDYILWSNASHMKSDIQESGYVFANVVVNHKLFQKYGMICRKVEFTFDENDDYSAKKNDVIDFVRKMEEPKATFTVKAVDLSMVETGVDCFRVGRQVRVICDSLGVNEWMTIEELSISLNDPTNCTVTLNGTLQSISKLVAGR